MKFAKLTLFIFIIFANFASTKKFSFETSNSMTLREFENKMNMNKLDEITSILTKNQKLHQINETIIDLKNFLESETNKFNEIVAEIEHLNIEFQDTFEERNSNDQKNKIIIDPDSTDLTNLLQKFHKIEKNISFFGFYKINFKRFNIPH